MVHMSYSLQSTEEMKNEQSSMLFGIKKQTNKNSLKLFYSSSVP